jgi:hypothetical protein
VVRQIDEHPAREALARELSDLRALVEAVLQHLVGLKLNSERLVDFPPEEFVTLHAGGVAGLGEAVWHDENLKQTWDIAIVLVRALKGRLGELGSPVDTTLTGSALHAGLDPSNGSWTCPAKFPFRNDLMLQSRGYEPQPPPSGNWSLRWMNPL